MGGCSCVPKGEPEAKVAVPEAPEAPEIARVKGLGRVPKGSAKGSEEESAKGFPKGFPAAVGGEDVGPNDGEEYAGKGAGLG